MALIALNVVGAITGVVSIGMMIPGLIPEKDDHKPIVRIAAGLSSEYRRLNLWECTRSHPLRYYEANNRFDLGQSRRNQRRRFY